MTPEKDALEEARRAGFDLSLLDSTLALTPEERALRHESALELVLELKAARQANEESASASATVR
jgi:hypothetical protein